MPSSSSTVIPTRDGEAALNGSHVDAFLDSELYIVNA